MNLVWERLGDVLVGSCEILPLSPLIGGFNISCRSHRLTGFAECLDVRLWIPGVAFWLFNCGQHSFEEGFHLKIEKETVWCVYLGTQCFVSSPRWYRTIDLSQLRVR